MSGVVLVPPLTLSRPVEEEEDRDVNQRDVTAALAAEAAAAAREAVSDEYLRNYPRQADAKKYKKKRKKAITRLFVA